MTAPVVSILTPNFNGSGLIHETLDSLLAQDYPHWECVVVDDGSSDASPAQVEAYAARDSRIRLLRRQRQPKGACACRNIGLDHSSGPLVMFLDNDDLLEPFALGQRAATLEARPDLDFAIFPSVMFENRPHDLRLWWSVPDSRDLLTRQFHQDAVCQGTGPLFRRSAFDRLGRWDESLLLWQDIDLFLRAYIQDYRAEMFWNLRPDLLNRRRSGSLSRGRYFEPGKQASRAQVVSRALTLLRSHGKERYLPEARMMLAEVAVGLQRSGQGGAARELVSLGRNTGCLTPGETRNLWALLLTWTRPVERLPGMAALQRALQGPFASHSRMCRVSYDERPCPGVM
ncbi:MAG: glycosyltransferase family 2 protein [Magnetococcus sp. WYHC-3]